MRASHSLSSIAAGLSCCSTNACSPLLPGGAQRHDGSPDRRAGPNAIRFSAISSVAGRPVRPPPQCQRPAGRAHRRHVRYFLCRGRARQRRCGGSGHGQHAAAPQQIAAAGKPTIRPRQMKSQNLLDVKDESSSKFVASLSIAPMCGWPHATRDGGDRRTVDTRFVAPDP